jgi:hypothetical protein
MRRGLRGVDPWRTTTALLPAPSRLRRTRVGLDEVVPTLRRRLLAGALELAPLLRSQEGCMNTR